MYFSSILADHSNIQNTKKTQGLNISTHQISFSEIVRDYNQLCAFYNNSLARLSASECEEFKNEIEAFFRILNTFKCSQSTLSSSERQNLQSIVNGTRNIRDKVAVALENKQYGRQNEADTF